MDYRKIKVVEREQVPGDLPIVWAWDLASSTKTQGDFSVGALGAVDTKGNVYLVNINRGKRTWPEQKRTILHCAELNGSGSSVAIETVAAWVVALEELKTAAAGRFIVRGYTPSKDKIGRANPWLAAVEGGKFHIVRGQWNQDFLHELEQFPNGTHDDQVDAVSVLWEATRRRQVLLLA